MDSYLFGDRDDQEWESELGSYGRTFPHEFTTPENPYFSTFLTISPSSLESEDNILQLDRTLADLFAHVDQEIGLENTLIVLSADHGSPEAPAYLKSIGIPADYVFPAVSYAVPSTSLERGTVPDNGLSVAVVHGSPWRYDTYVPILFAWNGIKPQTVSRRVYTVDVALTLATAVGTQPPSGAAGEVLLEVLGQ